MVTTSTLRKNGCATVALGLLALAAATAPSIAAADDPTPEAPLTEAWAAHGQITVIDQGNIAFRAPYSGINSLPTKAEGRETLDITLFAGIRPWRGAELWVNPEIDQGFGLHDTLGIAGFPSGEAYKVGKSTPYVRLQRLFLRQTVNLRGALNRVDADQNQLGGAQSDNRIVVTLGKFNVTDVFDTNTYAHDPRHDFLDWAVIDAGTFDYAADAWGYTVGGAFEWYQSGWVTRLGVFDLSIVPNSGQLDRSFGQFQMVGEIERDYKILGKGGALKLTGFVTRGRMGAYADAIALGLATGSPANVALVREYRGRGGVSFNLQQALTKELGIFARGGLAGGNSEPYEFSDIDQTLSVGLSLRGKRWGRTNDTLALAGVINGISSAHQQYFAAGGLGILIGDGQLPHYGSEGILETYYDFAVAKALHVSFDYQFITNPGYNRDRGPVSIFAARIHAQF